MALYMYVNTQTLSFAR